MSKKLEEPDVTPLINVNLVILVMVLAIASHAARLLPFALPKATSVDTALVPADEAVPLRVEPRNTYRLGGGPGLAPDDLASELEKLPDGTVVLVSMDPEAPYSSLVWAVDQMLARPRLRVAFGQPRQAVPATRAAKPPATE